MRYPFLSSFLSVILWGSILLIFALINFPKKPNFLNVEADMIFQESAPNQQIIEPEANKIRKIKNADKKIAVNNNKKSAAENSKPDNFSATPIYQPLPEIPEDLRAEAFSTFAIAHFDIAADGSAQVRLIQPCDNPRLNFLLLKTLKQWKFKPAKNQNGENISSMQDIKVRFNVE